MKTQLEYFIFKGSEYINTIIVLIIRPLCDLLIRCKIGSCWELNAIGNKNIDIRCKKYSLVVWSLLKTTAQPYFFLVNKTIQWIPGDLSYSLAIGGLISSWIQIFSCKMKRRCWTKFYFKPFSSILELLVFHVASHKITEFCHAIWSQQIDKHDSSYNYSSRMWSLFVKSTRIYLGEVVSKGEQTLMIMMIH